MFVLLYAFIGVLLSILINYLADVLPHTRKFSLPICPSCKNSLSIWEYLTSSTCEKCGKKRSFLHYVTAFCCVLFSVLLYYFPFDGLSYWAALPMLVFLLVIARIDIQHQVILIQTSIFGLVLFTFYGILLNGVHSTLLGGTAGLAINLVFYGFGILYADLLNKSRNSKVSEVIFGFGDVFVGTYLGLLVGWPIVLPAVFLGMLSAGAFSLVYMGFLIVSRRYNRFSSIPLSPFFIIAAIFSLYIF